MALKLTLKPNERIIVNGCALRNSGRRHVMMVETQADVVRGHDLLDEADAATPVSKVYFLIQIALVNSDLREQIIPSIQKQLGVLATVFGLPHVNNVFEAANYVSIEDYYKALRALRPVLRHEEKLLSFNVDSGQDLIPEPLETHEPAEAAR